MIDWFWQWWNWLWSEAGGAWAGATIGAFAVFFALQSWRASVAAIRSSYRPLVRPVQTLSSDGRWMLTLKNYGRGPAIGVVLLEGSGQIVETVDVIEPLGPREGDDETSRVGRHELRFELPFESDNFRLLYQDLGGRWHETSFECMVADRSDCDPRLSGIRFLGARRSGLWRPQIPSRIAQFMASVVSKQE